MSGQEVLLEDDEAVRDLLREANEGKKLILTKHGIVNVSSIDSITPHKEKLAEMGDLLRLGKTKDEAMDYLCPVSPFAKLLAPRMGMLSNESRNEIQEQVAREERGR